VGVIGTDRLFMELPEAELQALKELEVSERTGVS
jgi:hypothetical protein